MALLGAILAGGQSRRFGSDKALARVDGMTMLARAGQALAPHAQQVIVCGGSREGVDALPDWPKPGIGPLGGLNAALRYARQHGFDAVLSTPVDTFPLPPDLVDRLGAGPAAFSSQYLLGIWPASLQPRLDRLIASGTYAVRQWLAACGCRLVEERGLMLKNMNVPEDALA